MRRCSLEETFSVKVTCKHKFSSEILDHPLFGFVPVSTLPNATARLSDFAFR
jgi:hypothetical protein